MKSLVATGYCKTDSHVREFLKYLRIDQRDADRVIQHEATELNCEAGTLSFVRAADGYSFELKVRGDDELVRRIHQALTDSTRTVTVHWRCRIRRIQTGES